MKNQVKLAVSDIDGTLVNTDKKITSLTREAISAFQKSGGFFTLATGRIEESVLPYCRELNIQVPVILYNGARIYDPVSGRILWSRALSNADVHRAMEMRIHYPFDYLVYSEGNAYVFDHSDAVRQFEEGDGYKTQLIDDWADLKKKEITKILMIGDSSFYPRFRKEFTSDGDCSAALVQSEINYLEILPKGINKGVALKQLEKIMGINRGQIICFGDNLNDIEMLDRAGRGIAMANAPSQVKDASDDVTLDNNNDGVGRVLLEYISP